jgi:PAS domain S-box-containing protein
VYTGLQVQRERADRHRELTLIRETIIAASRTDDVDEVCRLIGRAVHSVNEHTSVIVTLYDPEIDAIRLRAFAGADRMVNAARKLLDRNPYAITLRAEDMGEESALYTSGRLERLPGGIHTLAGGKIPRTVCRAIERLANVAAVYTIGFALDERPFGGITIFTPQDIEIRYPGAIETLVSHLAVVLHQREAKSALQQSERRFRQLIESGDDIIFSLDRDGVVQMASGARLQTYGFQPADVVGNSLETFFGEGAAAYRVQHRRVLESGEALTYENTTTFDGQEVINQITIYPIKNQSGKVELVGVICRDVTEQRRTEARLRRQERLAVVGQLAAGIAHDFNNIMSVIVLYAQLAAQMPGLPERLRQHLAVINEQAHRSSELIEQILDFGRSTTIERRPLDLLALLEKIATLLRRTLPEHIAINLHHEGGPFWIEGDPTRLQQALMNLATNARDAMPGGGEIRVRLRSEVYDAHPVPLPEMAPGAWVRLDFTDTGTGMPPDVMDHLFEPFYTTKNRGEGTGLGLAQVHGIVSQHDGAITVKSQEGRGTTITLYLPAQPAPEPVRSPDDAGTIPTGHGEVLLVVEDDVRTQEALVHVLEQLRYQVRVASTGAEALELLLAEGDEIDMVISDAVMPELGGVELVTAMAAQNLDQPALIVSGYLAPENQAPLQAQPNFVGWLSKPLELEPLARAIAQALRANVQKAR